MVGIVPIVGQLVGAYEAGTGKDIFGKKLSDPERMIMALPVLTYTVSKLVPLLKTSPKGIGIAGELETATAKVLKAAKTGQDLADAESSLDRSIRTTPEHPFYVVGKGWIAAKELRVDDRLLSHNDRSVSIVDVIETGEVLSVYNTSVADYHTYFVGCDE